MRVFVLNTGRCGSVTFAAACRFIENYTTGHESRAGVVGDARFDYPDRHIEVDNRLSWFLGSLTRFDPDDTLFVHLRRDPEAVARSFLGRWAYTWRGGIIEAFAHALVMRGTDYDADERLDVCRFYVSTVTHNIASFLADKPNTIELWLERMPEDFGSFWHRIDALGDKEGAIAEWSVRHNASRSGT